MNLENQTIYDSEGFEDVFEIDAFVRERLLNGLDDIGLTLKVEDEITAFEEKRPAYLSPVAN